jgi:multidrug efflux pump subunit AcrB
MAIVLAVVIIYPFLRSWRATLITALAIPLSLLGTFIVMAWNGFNLETITLLALALVIGIIVDDAIVDVENISRHLTLGESPRQSAIKATSEIGLTVSAATFTIVAVFFPVGNMGGTIGQFFKPFGITVSAAVLTSLLVARTLSPVLAAFWLRPRVSESSAAPESFPLRNFYRRLLDVSLNHRFWVVLLAILSFVAGVALIPLIPQGFIPKLDRGEFNVTYRISPAYLEQTLRSRFQPPSAEKDTDSSPESTESDSTGSDSAASESPPSESAPNGADQLRTYAPFLEGLAPEQLERLKQLKRRAAKTYIIQPDQDLRDVADRFLSSPDRWPVLAKINNLEGFDSVEPGQAIVVLDLPLGAGAAEDTPAMSPEAQFAPLVLAESRQFAEQLEPAVLANDQVEAVLSIRGAINQGRLYVKLKADRSFHTAIVQEQVRKALPSLVGARASLEDIQFVDTGGDLPLKIAFQGDNIEELVTTVQRLKTKVSKLSGLVDVTATGDDELPNASANAKPNEILHLNGQRVAYLRANLAPGQALGEATATVVSQAQGLLPEGVTIQLGGDSQRSDLVIRSFGRTALLSIGGILVILLLLFRRLLDPLVIVLALPLSIIGAVLGLLITQSDVGMISLIGVIFLFGIVNKNAILIVDYTNQLKRSGLSQREALLTSAPRRLRPILMTTLSTILGMLPLALGWGVGAELRQPMAVAIIGGLTTSTILSLIVVPVLYSLVDDVEMFLVRSLRPHRPN